MTVKGNVEKPHFLSPQFDWHTRPSRSLLSHRSGGMHVQPVMVIYRCNSTWTLVKFRFSKHLKLFNFFYLFIFNNPPHHPPPLSHERCMYGHKEPPQRGDVQKILLHFLNKSRFIFICGRPSLLADQWKTFFSHLTKV